MLFEKNFDDLYDYSQILFIFLEQLTATIALRKQENIEKLIGLSKKF